MTPKHRFLLAIAIACPIAALVVDLGGCSNDQYIPLPVYEASIPDAPVNPDAGPDGGEASAEGATDAPVTPADAAQEGGEGGASDSPAEAPPDAPTDAVTG